MPEGADPLGSLESGEARGPEGDAAVGRDPPRGRRSGAGRRGVRGRARRALPASRRLLLDLLSFPGVEELLDVTPLRVAELEPRKETTCFAYVVVFHRRLEVLARRH